jgi:hypothetical protein
MCRAVPLFNRAFRFLRYVGDSTIFRTSSFTSSLSLFELPFGRPCGFPDWPFENDGRGIPGEYGRQLDHSRQRPEIFLFPPLLRLVQAIRPLSIQDNIF